ncbi:MAG: hypothetical protein JSR36_00550 [Proteobacteria bacterium]|nr:hypothetical protein [Pseudomonadota bacterium]
MNPRTSLLAVPLLGLAAAASQAADADFGKDLKATIALHGLPCDQIVSSTRNSDSDYNAVCKDGNRYHVFVDANGRVVVKKL